MLQENNPDATCTGIPHVRCFLLQSLRCMSISVLKFVTIDAVVLRVGDALIGVGKRAPHGFQCLIWSLLMARWIDSKAFTFLFPLH